MRRTSHSAATDRATVSPRESPSQKHAATCSFTFNYVHCPGKLQRLQAKSIKKFRRFLRFVKTAFSSARFCCQVEGRACFWPLLKMARLIPKAILEGRRRKRRPGSFWWQRMKCCRRCPLYDRQRQACGMVGSTWNNQGKEEPLGCGCFMPLKAGLPEAECWLWQRTNGKQGWADSLNAIDESSPLL